MKFTNCIIFITCNYDCYVLYGKCTEPNKTRLDLHITELESYVGQINKGYIVIKGIKSTSKIIRVI